MKRTGKQHIVDASDLRKWRTELPNLYDDLGLDPYEFRLLSHYKRVGNCTENVETTAEKCRMSTGKVSQARAALAKQWKLITLSRNKFGGFNVKVKDIWEKNFQHFLAKQTAHSKKRASRGEGIHQVMKGFTTRRRASPGDEGLHQVKQRNNHSKKQPIKKQPIKKQQQLALPMAQPAAVVSGNRNPGLIAHYAERMVVRFGIDPVVAREYAMRPHMTDEYLDNWEYFASRNIDEHLATEGTERPMQFLGPGFYAKRFKDGEISPIAAKRLDSQAREDAHAGDPVWQSVRSGRARGKYAAVGK